MTATILAPPKQKNIDLRPGTRQADGSLWFAAPAKRVRLFLLQDLLWVGIPGFIAVLAVSGFYYALLQVHWYYWPGHSFPYHILDWKYGWDHLFRQVWWRDDRHDIRNVGEGIGALVVGLKSLGLNWTKYWNDRPSDAKVAGRLAFSIMAGFGILLLAVALATEWSFRNGHYVSPAKNNAELYAILVGAIIGQVIGRIYRPAGVAIQMFLAGYGVRYYDRTGTMPRYVRYPLASPALRTLTAYMVQERVKAPVHGPWLKRVLPAIVFLTLAFAVVGGCARYGVFG